jgi:hypothetical protein
MLLSNWLEVYIFPCERQIPYADPGAVTLQARCASPWVSADHTQRCLLTLRHVQVDVMPATHAESAFSLQAISNFVCRRMTHSTGVEPSCIFYQERARFPNATKPIHRISSAGTPARRCGRPLALVRAVVGWRFVSTLRLRDLSPDRQRAIVCSVHLWSIKCCVIAGRY